MVEPMYTYVRTCIAVRSTVYVLHSSSIELVWKFCLVQQKKAVRGQIGHASLELCTINYHSCKDTV